MAADAHLRDFFGWMNSTESPHLLRNRSTDTFNDHPLRTNLLAGSRSANFNFKVVNSHTYASSSSADVYFGYDVEQFSYILIASGLLGSVTFVVIFYIVMACRKIYLIRRNARWNAMGCEVYLVHWPDMPRSTTDVFIGAAGFPPLVPLPEQRVSSSGERLATESATLADAFIQLTPNDVRIDFPYPKKYLQYPERLI
jgi:hypothetical protein